MSSARSKPERTPQLQGNPSWERTIKAAKGKRWADQFDWELDKGNTRLFVAASNLLDRVEELERAREAARAEGFHRGVEAAADVVDAYPRPITGRIFALTDIAKEIRALRPEGEK